MSGIRIKRVAQIISFFLPSLLNGVAILCPGIFHLIPENFNGFLSAAVLSWVYAVKYALTWRLPPQANGLSIATPQRVFSATTRFPSRKKKGRQ